MSEFCGGAKNAEEAFLLWQREREEGVLKVKRQITLQDQMAKG